MSIKYGRSVLEKKRRRRRRRKCQYRQPGLGEEQT
jgi:hypothetical protein